MIGKRITVMIPVLSWLSELLGLLVVVGTVSSLLTTVLVLGDVIMSVVVGKTISPEEPAAMYQYCFGKPCSVLLIKKHIWWPLAKG